MRGGIIRQDAGAKAPGDAGRTCESDFTPLQTLHRCVGFEQARPRPDDVSESLQQGEQFLGADAPRDEDYARSVVFVGPRFEVLRRVDDVLDTVEQDGIRLAVRAASSLNDIRSTIRLRPSTGLGDKEIP